MGIKKYVKNACLILLSLATSLVPLTQNVAYAEEITQQPSNWAISELVDAQAMDLLIVDYETTILNKLNEEQLANLVELTDEKLSLLGLEKKDNYSGNLITTDLTRENLLNVLYNELNKYNLPDGFVKKNETAKQFMLDNNIIRGYNDGSLKLEQECTVQEAMILAQRFVNVVYNKLDMASEGLLWKAEKNGNTVYLFGSVHVDRGNIYPFDDTVMDALDSSDVVSFELDFYNKEGLEYLTKAQMYDDGTTLKDNISEELYNNVKKVMNSIGQDESFNVYRPWAIASSLTSLLINDDVDSSKAPLIIDMYIYCKALYEGKDIEEVEGYKYQADLFNSLSKETQEKYLQDTYDSYIDFLNNGNNTSSLIAIDSFVDALKNGDEGKFDEVFGKDSDENSKDELNKMLFDKRDEHMAKYVMNWLDSEGDNTYFLVVGAGHMVGDKGIVQRLKDAGYNVNAVN